MKPLNNIKNLYPLLQTNSFPFLEKTFDDIDEYAILARIQRAINEVITNNNTLNDNFTELNNYVTDYFKNLDVQDEIDNKLQQMAQDGTLYNLINQELFTDINNKILQNSENIGTLNTNYNNTVKKNENSIITENMLTDEVKKLMTGGSVAVVGENSVGNSNIQNNAISFIKLDDTLQSAFYKYFTNNDLPFNLQGYAENQNSKLNINTNSYYRYSRIPLTKGNIYYYSGLNSFNMPGLVIADGANNIIYTTNTSENQIQHLTAVFQANQENLIAYINTPFDKANTTIRFFYKGITFLSLNKIITLLQRNKITPIKEIEEYYINVVSTLNNSPIITDSFESNIYMYKLNKNCIYNIKSTDIYGVSSIAILNEDLTVNYLSSNSYLDNKKENNYTFTASNNGYVLITDYQNIGYEITIIDDLNINTSNNSYKNKNWVAIGDSLTDPNTLGIGVKNYVNYVSERLELNTTNLGVGGTGFAKGYSENKAYYQRLSQIPTNTNVVTIFASLNDCFANLPLGTITDTGETTVAGLINKTITEYINNYSNYILGVILPTPWIYNADTQIPYKDYVNLVKSICEKNSIPCLDLFTKSNLYPDNVNFKEKYFNNADGVHPNTEGHKRFSAQIVNFITRILY